MSLAPFLFPAWSEAEAEDAGTPEARAIAYLAREVPRWRAGNDCASCHHNGDGARALYRAARLGFEVDERATADSTRWLRRPGAWDDNGGDGPFSDKRLARIQFAQALAEAVEAGAVADRSALADAAARLAEDQEADGSWTIDGPDAIGSPATYGRPLATRVALEVLRGADPDRHRDRIERAESWLRDRPVRNVLDASVALLGPGPGPGRDRAFELLRESESPEGGWGPYRTSPPEAFDTALALLGLADESGDEAAAMVRRGRSYLIATQLESGAWPETTRPAGAESVAQRTSTTAWATLALLATRPRSGE